MEKGQLDEGVGDTFVLVGLRTRSVREMKLPESGFGGIVAAAHRYTRCRAAYAPDEGESAMPLATANPTPIVSEIRVDSLGFPD